MKGLVALTSGFLFAIGLGLSGMTQPHIVRGFLDIFGSWDWSLIGVMGGAICVHAIAYHFIVKRTSPVFEAQFRLPTKGHIDLRLILGAIIFGFGWGWVGICPGPGIVSMVSGNIAFIYFIGSMLVGMKVFQIVEARFFIKL